MFTYDNLHRLDLSTLNGLTNLDLSYNALGNISSKSDVGSYTYHATKKHAVTAAGSYTFAYDANGNVSTRNGSTISWYSYNLPNTISATGSNSSQFFYAPDRARWKQVASYGGAAETTITIGGLIEKVTLGSVTSWKHYIVGGSGPVAVYTRKSDLTNAIHYLTKDHLGSVDSVTNGSGAIEVRLSFASFGARRNETGWSGNPTSGDWNQITATTRHGFTFHEMLDNLNLIHMNGRVYDQVVGRFLSADPFVQAPGFTQSFNRYSYTFNNPLSFLDPSGFLNGRELCNDCGGARISIQKALSWAGVTINKNRESRMPGNGGGNAPRTDQPRQNPPTPAPRPTSTVPITSCPGDFMPCGSTVDGNPFVGFDAGPGEAAARAGFALYNDPNLSEEAKAAIALSGMSLMVGGTVIAVIPAAGESLSAALAATRLYLGPTGPVFGRQALGGSSILGINSNAWLRVGWGWHGTALEGQHVFRLSGKVVELFVKSGHIDLIALARGTTF